MKVKERIKKAFKKAPKKILIPILTIAIILTVIFLLDGLLPKWQISKEKPKTEKKVAESIDQRQLETTEIQVPETEPAQKEKEGIKIVRDPTEEPLIVKEVEKLRKEVAKLKAAQKETKKAETTQKAETKEAKTEAPKNVTVEELYKAIYELQTKTTIKTQEQFDNVNWQIAELRNQIAEAQSMQYQEPEVVEHHYYSSWPYYSPFLRVCFLGLWPYYPCFYGPYWYVSSFDYYYSRYYSNRYPPQNPNARWSVSKDQLSSRQRIKYYPSSNTQTTSSNVKVQSKVPGTFDSPWGPLPNRHSVSSRTSSNSKKVSISSNQSRSGIQTISRPTKTRSSSSLSSTRGSARTTKATRTKVRKK